MLGLLPSVSHLLVWPHRDDGVEWGRETNWEQVGRKVHLLQVTLWSAWLFTQHMVGQNYVVDGNKRGSAGLMSGTVEILWRNCLSISWKAAGRGREEKSEEVRILQGPGGYSNWHRNSLPLGDAVVPFVHQ